MCYIAKGAITAGILMVGERAVGEGRSGQAVLRLKGTRFGMADQASIYAQGVKSYGARGDRKS